MSAGLYSGVSGLALGIGLYRNVSGLWGGASGLIDGFGGADPYAGASLYLNFLDPTLDSRITFSRGTNATLIDSTGKLTYAPNNLLAWSEDFTQSSQWGLNNVTVAANATAAPTGAATADKIDETTATGVHRLAFAPAFALAPHTLSVYAKAAERNWIAVGNASDSQLAFFNLTNGTVGTIIGAITPTITGVGNGWYRCSVTFTPSIAAMRTCVFNVCSADNVTNYTGVTGNGVFLWGAQLEIVTYQTTPGTYNQTLAPLYYGPRFDYDPVTLAPRGLLIEEARTNIVTYSEQFDNAAWTKVGLTVTANATASPDGTVGADKLAEDATAAAHQTYTNPIAISAGSTYTYTVYAKQAERNWISISAWDTSERFTWFNLANGTIGTNTVGNTATITPVGNGWYRCTVTRTVSSANTYGQFFVSTNDNVVNYAGTAGSGLYIWGAQLEAGSFATSYIPTVASTVTRNADVATMTGTNFSSWYNQSQGTFVAEGSVASNVDSGTGNYYYSASDGTISNMILSAEVNGTVSQVITGGVVQFNETVGGEPTGVLKVAVAYQANNTVSSANGAIGTTDTSVTLPTVDRLGIGARGDLSATSYLSGHIRTIAYFNTRLPNAQLQTLTAPSLATTLSLDFTSGSYNVGF